MSGRRPPRIALCHEWLTTFGGSDQVAQRIARVLDIKDVFTGAADRQLVSQLFPTENVRVITRIGSARWAAKHWQWLLPEMARAWRRLDLSTYDIVITSSHAVVNAVRARAGAIHISYCHTPIRYVWEWREEIDRVPAPLRPLWPAAASAWKRIDRRWAQNVSSFIANSENVADRIRRYYGRTSTVLHPPVDTEFWHPGDSSSREDFFLFAGRLVPYKRADLAIDAALQASVPLVVAGTGPEFQRLRAKAGSLIRFVQNPTNEELRDLYRRARALVFPGVEDFGMSLVEAQACGTPVVAFNRGGATESVRHGVTGVLYDDHNLETLANILRNFDPRSFDRSALRKNASAFDARRFDSKLREIVSSELSK